MGKEKKNEDKAEKSNRNSARDSCMNPECLTNAVLYMKMLKGRVKNFWKQEARIATNIKQAGGKAGKLDIFKPLIAQLRSVGGGNSSNLLCNGKTGSGADTLANLTAELTLCETTINTTCNADYPVVNQTHMDMCKRDADPKNKKDKKLKRKNDRK